MFAIACLFFFFSSRRRHTRYIGDWSSDVCSSDLTYPWSMYVRVIDLLVEHLDATIVVTGARDERALVEQVLGNVQERNRKAVLACAGIFPFPEFCALIEAADLIITNNTGPMHISAAVKTPVVA